MKASSINQRPGHTIVWSVSLFVLGVMLSLPQIAHASEPAYLQADRTRIQKHLERVIRLLRAKDVSQLSQKLQEARKRNIARLVVYRAKGVFPHNTGHATYTPYFIDRDGRACAVGHLMLESGDHGLAWAIARRENNAYLADIKNPDAPRWIAQSGLTAAECALIQPTYGGCENQPDDPVCGADGNTHQSECWAKWNGTTVKHKGKCGSEPIADTADSGNGVIPPPDTAPKDSAPQDKATTPEANTGAACSTLGSTAPTLSLLLMLLAMGAATRKRR